MCDISDISEVNTLLCGNGSFTIENKLQWPLRVDSSALMVDKMETSDPKLGSMFD